MVVRDHRTLAGMERAGYIIRNGKPGETERHWTGRAVPVITVKEGPKLRSWSETFTYRGHEYQIRYFDGCFHPFVWRTDTAAPSFV